jgi:hypothetical protein
MQRDARGLASLLPPRYWRSLAKTRTAPAGCELVLGSNETALPIRMLSERRPQPEVLCPDRYCVLMACAEE